jgi:purine-nucleoside phosphorylase
MPANPATGPALTAHSQAITRVVSATDAFNASRAALIAAQAAYDAAAVEMEASYQNLADKATAVLQTIALGTGFVPAIERTVLMPPLVS